MLLMFPAFVRAGLDGAVIVGGQGVIVNPNLVQQNSSKLAINAQAFNVGIGETFTINQNYTTDLALIRVLGQNPSSILGSVRAIGQLFISNPNGLLIGAGAEVNVGGFLGTSLDISPDDFMAGNMVFHNRGSAGAVINKGILTANEGGYVALLAPEVRNEGVISATLGKVLLASGDQITLTLNNGVLFDYSIDQGTFDGLVENRHLIQADGGQVFMSGKAADALTSSVVNNTGILRARTVQNQNGVIKLMADMQTGTVNVDGIIDASAPQAGDGGHVETSAANVKVAEGAQISTLSATGDNGTWLIDPQDYIIGAGGNISGATLSFNLGLGNVTILSSGGGTVGNGDIHVNEDVSWSVNNLTLTAARDINVNAVMTASGTSTLTLNPATANGTDAAVAGGTVKMGINPAGTFSGRIDLPGRSGNGIISIGGQNYTVINSLGAEGSNSGNDLQGINGNLAGRYVLGGDIDASATSGWNGGLGFAPISTFSGQFDGFGHTINDLTINRPTADFIGLFGVATNASIRNIGLENAAVTGRGGTAGLVGLTMGSTSITNSYVTGVISGTSGVGGLVGLGYGTLSVSGSHATSDVSGVDFVGGLLGYSSVSVLDISNTRAGYSYASGSVSATGSHVGGVIGTQGGGVVNIVDYTNTAQVTGGGRVGGLIGSSEFTTLNITNSTAGSVTANGDEVGGFVGLQFGGTVNISDSAHAGNVIGSNRVGGLVGNNFSGALNIANSTAGNVTGSSSNVGGLVGYATATHISNSYVTNTVNGVANTGGLIGYAAGSSSINRSYVTGEVSGTDNVGGLVGQSAAGSTIAESFASGNVTSVGGSNIGGLVGQNAGTITDTYATGAVGGAGATKVGGLVGANNGSITRTYATGAVIGNAEVGGLVGVNTGAVNSSYWDVQTTGMMTSAGGTGKTTQEMKTLSTYAGWNIDDAGNTGKIWRIYGNQTAPLLRYFMAPATITGGGGSYVYNGTPQSGTGMTYTDTVTGLPLDTSSLRFSHIVTAAHQNIGNYAVSYSDQLGYDITGEYFTITPAPLTVTANNDSKYYDGQPYGGGNGVSYSGFVNGESSAVLSGSLVYGGSSQGASSAGLYSITPSGLSALNYSLTYVDGTLEIKPKTVIDQQSYLSALNSGNYYQTNQITTLNIQQHIDRSSCGAGGAVGSASDQRFAMSEASSFALDGNGALDLTEETDTESITSDALTVTILNGGARYPENRAVKAQGEQQISITKPHSGGIE